MDHAELQLGTLVGMAEKYGANVVIWLSLCRLSSVPFWWSTPRWPFVVELFRRLDDPDHKHSQVGSPPGPPPAPAYDRAWFRQMLLAAPEQLPTEVVDFCIHAAAIGSIRPDPWSRI